MTNTNRLEFADQLAALAQHLTEHRGLPQIYDVQERIEAGFEVRLMSGQGEQALVAWAQSLPGRVSSHAVRIHGDHHLQIDGHVLGELGGHMFEVVGTLPDDAVPAEPGRHEWTVTR